MEDKTAVASEIIRQLGGMNRLNIMTGAYSFVAHPDGVSFRIKNPKANYIKVTLTSSDLYDLEVGRIRSSDYKVLVNEKGLYNDMLRPAIEKATGMYLSLGTLGVEKKSLGGVLLGAGLGVAGALATQKMLHNNENNKYRVVYLDGNTEREKREYFERLSDARNSYNSHIKTDAAVSLDVHKDCDRDEWDTVKYDKGIGKFAKGGLAGCGCSHTKAFKNGGSTDEPFKRIMYKEGDERLEHLDPMPIIDPNFFKPYSDLKDLREKVKKYLLDNFRDEEIINIHTGLPILITKRSIQEIIQKTGDSKLKCLSKLRDIIKQAFPASVEEVTKFNVEIKKEAKFGYLFECYISYEGETYIFGFRTFYIESDNIHLYSGYLNVKNPEN